MNVHSQVSFHYIAQVGMELMIRLLRWQACTTICVKFRVGKECCDTCMCILAFCQTPLLPSLHDASGLYRQTFLEFVPGVGTVGVSYLTQCILLLPIKWWAEISLLEDLHVWLSHFSWFFGELIQVEIFIPTFECFSFLGEKGSYGWGIEEIFCCSVALHVQNFDFCP